MEIATHSFFKHFDAEIVPDLVREIELRNYRAGEIVFEEGDSADALFLVLEGTVEVSKAAQGSHLVLSHAREGDYFGELGIIDGMHRSARATSQTDCRLGILNKPVILWLFERAQFSAIQTILQRLCHTLRETNDKFVGEVIRKEKQTLVGEMAASILHDLKNPLSAVLLAMDLIAEKHSDEETQTLCSLSDAQIHHMVSMIEEVLEFSRGQQRIERKSITLRSLFDSFKMLNESYLCQFKVDFQVVVDDTVVILDERKMLRVLQNLVSNAVGAMGDDGGTIRLMGGRKGNEIVIEISDNGPGIPETIRHNLFQPFVTHGKKNGTGLGLAIVKSIVEAHAGTITFTTETGKGTTFSIRLPLL